MTENYLIDFENVSFRYFDKIAFSNTSLKIFPQEHTAIIGNNASGKTCLGKALAGKVPTIKGKSSFQISFLEIVFIDFQSSLKLSNNLDNPYLQQRWNSFDNDSAPLVKDFFWPGQELSPKTISLLKDFNATHLLSRRNIHLSNGELKKMELIRAIARNAKVLILDNAYTGLDMASRNVLEEALKKAGEACTIILLALPQDPVPSFISKKIYCDNLQIVNQLPGINSSGNFLPKYLIKSIQADTEELVKLKDINIKYGEKQILNKVNWTIKPQEHWALLGPNGSGKTTLLSLLAADNPQAYARDIHLFGKKRGSGETIWDIKRKIGFISPEQHQFTPGHKSLNEILIEEIIWMYKDLKKEDIQEHIQKWLEWFEIGEINLKQHFNTLSSGQQRLILFIRTLLYPFSLLIADEPCQGLDEGYIGKVRAIFHHLAHHTDTASIFVTHRIQELPETTTLIFDMATENRNNI